MDLVINAVSWFFELVAELLQLVRDFVDAVEYELDEEAKRADVDRTVVEVLREGGVL